ncbi:endonuclease/exonuclease/phosphatase family protein [Rubrivirga litoralis]|uniref:Endonuclease/exonuclease/phosphatase family protein n=1 Tax=Rubrivirga litoralis TaxID=3075598 RepID=A0ABU3BPJ9_9BACT|nr:endonuclease/exonuclease/phosphatase family protein [Rubrivirga sp. F394]MDT0631219.1 endonuclease/exonuclease/phosphatase family protein [Rubrivirga sp. F394]
MSEHEPRRRRSRSGSRSRSESRSRSGRSGWGPADWAHLRRDRRITAQRRRALRRRWAGRLGVGGAAALAALAAVGASARWVRPAGGWVPQVAALLLPALGPALGLSAVAAGAVAVRSRRPVWGVGAVALAAAAAAVWVRHPAPPPAPGGAEGLRVMTLNVGRTSSEAAYRVADYVQRTEPDVVFLQEADARSIVVDGQRLRIYHPTIEAILSSGAYRVGGGVDTLVARERGPANRQVFLTRLPVLAHEAGELGPPNTEPSVYARAEVSWRGRRVALYNVHLRPFNPAAEWSFRRMVNPAVWAETPGRLREFFAVQGEEAERLAALIEADPLPVVVAGDFNATADQWSRARLARHTREVLGRRPWAATRPDSVPVAPIDGVLVGAGWSVRAASVGPPGLSDHRAVSAELVYSGE